MEVERKRRKRRLGESAYNEEYRRWRIERMPRYLQEKSKGQKLKTIEGFDSTTAKARGLVGMGGDTQP